MFLPLLVIFVVVPIVELYVIIKVGEAIGVLPTIALLVLDSFLGAALMKSQGRAAWRRFNATLSAGRMPTREVIDGTLVVFGGAFLITPGFVSDLIGFALLVPPTRALIRAAVVRVFSRRLVVSVGGPAAGAAYGAASRVRGARRPGPPADGDVVDSTAREVDPRELPES